MKKQGQCPLLPPSTGPGLGQIFRDLGGSFLETENLTNQQKRVFHHIGECRTAAMGGTAWQCQECGHWVGAYHSCRDRHCPQCQGKKTADWVDQRTRELLPVPYFHVVFTLPHRFNHLVSENPKDCLSLLFQAASKTLLTFAHDPKYLGATPGIIMVLHTWGQKLNLHYHVHCIVTAGGLTDQKDRWLDAPRPAWLFPVKALAAVFRGKYLEGLNDLYREGLITFSGRDISTPVKWGSFKRWLAKPKKWNVYAKAPVAGVENLVKYLARYAYRIAFHNSRILSYQDGRVTFRYKDYREKGRKGYQRRVLTLPVDEFARCFLRHVLPHRFMRIRYYGLLASRNKKKNLAHCRRILTLMGRMPEPNLSGEQDLIDSDQKAAVESDEAEFICPYCRKGMMEPMLRMQSKHQKRARCLLWDTS